jgi:multiple sugar transport system ATP-binding protein
VAEIEIDHLTKSYNSENVVDNISLKIEDNEFFVFVGPSGSGKSTILRLIAGLAKPTAGDIKFDGEAVTHIEARDRNVAMVFQNYALYPHKNVFDNIAFGLRARKTPAGEIGKRVDNIAGMLGIKKLLKRMPGELSGGERQRVAIGRAMVRDPQAYLLDEPLSNLDARLRIDMRNELAKIHRRVKTTFVYVTHDQIEAMTLGQRIAVINNGKIEQIATPGNLYNFPANKFVAGFIGTPPMNFIDGKLEYDKQADKYSVFIGDASLKLVNGRLPGYKPGRRSDIIIGVRPESIKVNAPAEFLAKVDIDRIEPIGFEGLIYFELPGSKMVLRTSDWNELKNEKKLSIGLDALDIHIFNPENERCIWSKGRSNPGNIKAERAS